MRRLMGMALGLLAAGTAAHVSAQHGGTLPSETAAPTDLTDPPFPEAAVVGPGEPDPTAAAALTGPARAAYQSWPAGQRATYDGWPQEYRTYVWLLSPNQQRMWFKLTDAQRATVFGMTPGQRLAAWQVIEARSGASAPAPQGGNNYRD